MYDQYGNSYRKPSPTPNGKKPSASNFALGTTMKGPDGRMYVVKKQWCLVKDD